MGRSGTIVIIEIIVVLMICGGQPAAAQNVNICEQVTEIPKIECEALVALYNSTNGNEWTFKNRWLTTNMPCEWYGVKCVDGHVMKLSLRNNRLNGNIPSELDKLTTLEHLDLSNNQLSGGIPPELGNLVNLTELYLFYSQLSGSIPPELGNLTNLESLGLGGNQLSGSIPSKLGNLFNLKELGLSDNQLSGSIPPELGNLARLESLEMSFNQLSGSILPWLGNLTKLRSFFLVNNQLSGSIPPELGNLASLKGLNLSDNQLSDSIPPDLGDLVNLEQLTLSDNQLSGSIPPELGDLVNLKQLDLSNNQLSGSIPVELNKLTKLYRTALNLSGNQLCKPVDASFQKWLLQYYPNAAPYISCICQKQTEIPETECEALVTLYISVNGDHWKNNTGWIQTTSPCHWEYVTCHNGHVTELSLNKNQLKGSFPSALGDLPELTHLDLSSNQFSGSIPPEISKFTRLRILDLQGNQLTGRIPPELSTLPDLEYLNLSGNQLCEPTDTFFRRWVNGLEFYDDTCRICYSDLYGWLPVLTIILGSSLLISGIMMGVYASLKQIYGTSYDYLFGYSRDETNALKITGLLTRAILTGGLFSILGGVCGLIVVSYEKIGDSLILQGILLGVATGVLYSLFSRKEKIYNRAALYEKIYGDDIFNYIKKAWRTGSSTIVVGLFTGMIIGAITAGLFGEMTHGDAGMLAGVMTGVVVGGVAGFFGGLASTITGWFPGGVVGGIAGGIAGHLAYYRLSHLAGFTLVKDGGLSEGIGMGIAGALSGIIVGYVVGLIISLIAVVLTRIILSIMMMVNKLVSFALVPSLIVSRFKTIICGNCLRYTEPLKSWYEDGIRHCEHCHERVEYTPDPGVVRLIFGKASPAKSDGRIFALSNPDFEQKDQPIDVSEVYIDPKTCDLRLFERFITYIINHPPKYGLQSIQIFYRGELDDLGQNLKNTLRNNFEYIKGLH